MVSIPSANEIQQLVDASAAERVDLEFKEVPWDKSDQGKREALKDITALANTRGGLLLLGIAENNNAAQAIAPLTIELAESERSRINDLIHAGVEPRLYGVAVEAVLVPGGAVLAVSVPRSPSRPHRVTTNGSNRFWLRNSTGAYEANVMDLRGLFLQSAEVVERAERYHSDRMRVMREGDIVPNLSGDRSSIVLHVIPVDAFSGSTTVDPRRAYELQGDFMPIGASGFTPRFTFEGFLNFRGGEPCHGYTLVRRNGIVEAIKVGLASKDDILPAYPTESRIARATHRYIGGLIKCGAIAPFLVFITLEGAGGRRVVYDSYHDTADAKITREDLHLPITAIENVESIDSVGLALRPAFDAMWNAGGFVGSMSYEGGQWAPKSSER
jgi:hypothetical protein